MDVDFPIDIMIYRRGSFHMVERHFTVEDISAMTSWWQDQPRGSIEALPSGKWNELLQNSESP